MEARGMPPALCMYAHLCLSMARSCGWTSIGHQVSRAVSATWETKHVPAPGTALWPPELLCPHASNQGDWDSGTNSVWTPLLEGIYHIYTYIYLYMYVYTHICVCAWPPPQIGKGARYGCLCCALVICLLDQCGQTCLHVNVMSACALWTCAYQQCIFSLITGHICGRGAATASKCWIQHSIFPVTNPVRNNYTNFRDSCSIPTVITYSVEQLSSFRATG